MVTLPAARPLGRVGIAGTGSAQVQIGDGPSWHSIGSLAAGYTELPASGVTANEIRLVWRAGSAPPVIAELVPWYADTPAVELYVTPASVDAAVGSSVTVSVGLTATQSGDVPGPLRVAAPSGVTASPSSTGLTLLRGAAPTIPITLRASEPGSYHPPITFAGLSATITFNVHPKVSTAYRIETSADR